MQGKRLLDRLVDTDVIDDSGELPVFSASFRDRVDDYETELALQDGEAIAEYVHEELPELGVPNADSTFDADDAPYLAELLALADHLADVETTLQVFPTLDLFGETPPPMDGTPELFVQVTGPRLRTLAKVYERLIVYAWGYECPPCDTVQGDFEELLEDPIEGIPMVSVCGEDCAGLLYEEFELRGAPTVLFVLDGRVDLRLEGAQHRNVLERELEKFPTISSPYASGSDEGNTDSSEEASDV